MYKIVSGLASAILLCMFVSGSLSQEQQKDGRYYEGEARKAYEAKDYPLFLSNIKLAAELRPNHPRLIYNLAAAYALNGQSETALTWLNKLASMGLVSSPQKDHDFDALKNEAKFSAIIGSFERNHRPLVRSVKAFSVPEKGLVPESVAYDPQTQTFYLSSVYKRKILSVNKAGEIHDFSTMADGLWSVMGMKVDHARRALWVTTTAHPQMSDFKTDDSGKSAILKYDLRTNRLVGRFQPPDLAKPHWFGDLAISSDGDVYASDSINPAIYVIRHATNKIEAFIEDGPFVSPQGLDFTADQKHLFLADYSKGLFVIDVATRQVKSIAADFTLLGIDGLYSYKGSLLAVQNGVNPQRLVRYFVSKHLDRIENFEVLEANNPIFDEITLGVLVEKDFYFIANSQWGAIDKNGNLAPVDKLTNPTILKLRL